MGEWDTGYATQTTPDAADTVLSRDVSATPPSGGTVKDLPLSALLALFLSLGGTFTAPSGVTAGGAVPWTVESTDVDAFLQVMNVLAPNLADGDASVFQVGRSLSTKDALQLIHLTANGAAKAIAFLGLFGTGNGIWTDEDGGLFTGSFNSPRNTLDDGSGNAVIAGTLATDMVLGGAHDLAGGVSGWLAALANRHYSAAATICMIGDSITAGNGATAWERSCPIMLQDRLNALYPSNGLATHGRGLLIPLLPFSGLTPGYVTVTGTPDTVFGNGFNRATYDISAGGGCTLTYDLTGDQFYLYYANQPSGGSFTWQLDGGTVNTVSTSAGSVADGQVIGIPGGAVGSSHTLVITWHSGGAVWIDGVLEYNGDTASGIQVFNCGNPGSATSDWVTQDFTAIAALFPSVYVLELMGEDVESTPPDSADPATAKANMITIIEALIAANATAGAPVPTFVLLGAYDITVDGPFVAPWADYVAAMYEIEAARSDTTVLALTARMPTATAGGLYFTDAIHPSDIGHSYIADLMAAFLGPQ